MQRAVAFPVVGANVGNHALHGGRRIVARGACRAAVISARYRHRAAVRVEEHLRSIEAEAVPGSPGAICAVRVDLPGAQVRDVRMPVVVSAIALRIERDHSRGRRVVRVVEEEELEARRIGRIDAEVDAVSRKGGSERVRATRVGNLAFLSHRSAGGAIEPTWPAPERARTAARSTARIQPSQPTGHEVHSHLRLRVCRTAELRVIHRVPPPPFVRSLIGCSRSNMMTPSAER